MQDFITLSDISTEALINDIHNLSSSFKTDCDIHGKDVESLINSKCAQCVRDKISKEENQAREFQLMKKKELAGIKSLFMNATFDNYIPENSKQQLLVERLKAYKPIQNIILMGKTGTGKTHLLIALIDKFIRQGLKCHYVKFYQLNKIRIEDKILFQKILTCDFLVIDEFGVMANDFKSELLFEIIDMRYDDKKYIALISNLEADKIKPSEDGKTGLSETMYSRLKQNCLAFNCDWSDYRLKTK